MTAAPIYRGEIPYLTTEQMIEVDRAMIEDFGIELLQMMENAGRALAHLARARFLGGYPLDKRVIVMAGTGGNGGGALVCARRLHIWGTRIKVLITKPDEDFAPVPARQLGILRRIGVEAGSPETIVRGPELDLIVDGIIGYSLKGAPRDTAGELIRWANAQHSPVLALDAPSGVDTTTGTAFDPAVVATATMTLALPKEGLRAPGVEARVGELYLADISVPPSLYAGPPWVCRWDTSFQSAISFGFPSAVARYPRFPLRETAGLLYQQRGVMRSRVAPSTKYLTAGAATRYPRPP